MTKTRLLTYLLTANILLVCVVMLTVNLLWSYLDNNTPQQFTTATINNSNDNQNQDILVEVGTESVFPLIAYQQDNYIRILQLRSADNYEEVFSFSSPSLNIPLPSQVKYRNGVYYLESSLSSYQLKYYELPATRTTLYDSVPKINSILPIGSDGRDILLFTADPATDQPDYFHNVLWQFSSKQGLKKLIEFNSTLYYFIYGLEGDNIQLNSTANTNCMNYQFIAQTTQTVECIRSTPVVQKYSVIRELVSIDQVNGLPESYATNDGKVLRNFVYSATQYTQYVNQPEVVTKPTPIYAGGVDQQLNVIAESAQELFLVGSESDGTQNLITVPIGQVDKSVRLLELPKSVEVSILGHSIKSQTIYLQFASGTNADLYTYNYQSRALKQVLVPSCGSKVTICRFAYLSNN